MKDKKLTIEISKPVNEVFNFVLNPNNTPKWINSIKEERTNEWPVKLGTIYKNRGNDNIWSQYTLAEYKENEIFVMDKGDGNYHVRYTFRPIGNNMSKLEYYEWVEHGELEEPFTQEILNKLKEILER